MSFVINFAKHKFAVIGLGDTGVSIIRYLRQQKAHIAAIYDTRATPPNLDIVGDVPIHLGALKHTNFNNVDIIVVSPGISAFDPALIRAQKDGKEIIGDIELFADAIKSWKSKIIGITGSNGKTTVTTLTGYLAKQAGYMTLVAGNIGTPVLDSYLTIIKTNQIPQIIVLELSSFQLETIHNLQLDCATVLNISADHLDRYHSLLEYAYIKERIFCNCKIQVLNRDDIFVKAMRRTDKREQEVIWFGDGLTYGFSLVTLPNTDKLYLTANGDNYLDSAELSLCGRHNYHNVLASLALLSNIGVNIHTDNFKQALREFQGLEHRMQAIVEHDGVLYIEDSKGTNVGAVIAGLSGLTRPVHLILGGDGKGQDFSPLRHVVTKHCHSVALIGQDKLTLAKVLDGTGVALHICQTLEEAVAYCVAHAKSGDCVLLSPACASWDMFANYKQRAKAFIDSVYENINQTC